MIHFLPLFLMPDPPIGPLPEAFAWASFKAFCCSLKRKFSYTTSYTTKLQVQMLTFAYS